MKIKAMAIAGFMGSGLFLLTAQQATQSRVFTPAQSAAGRVTYERTCGKCHSATLLGRTGDKGELPPIDSLPDSYQKFIRGSRGRVPPLAGKVFLERWGGKTAAELIARFQITADDPFFGFEGLNAESTVDLTAYVLEVNGAKPGTQPLTKATDSIVNLITAAPSN